MPIEFRPATLENSGLFVSISGGSRCGKTVSALRLAHGIARAMGKKAWVAAIDTEGGRMSHHAQRFPFRVFNMQSPYTPTLFAEAAESAQAAGAAALICDSFSLEWNGVGGVTWLFEDEFKRRSLAYAAKERLNVDDGYRNDKFRDACWAYAKAPHREMRNRLMALNIPIIFCSRANEVAKHLGGGWKIEQDQRWLYEWTFALTMHSDAPGMPNYAMKDSKGKDLHKGPPELHQIFPPNRLIGEAAGEALHAWRNGQSVALRDEAQVGTDKQRDGVARMIMQLREAETMEQINAIVNNQGTQQWRERLRDARPELEKDIAAAVRDAFDRFRPADDPGTETGAPTAGAAPGDDDDDFPGRVTPREAA